MRNILLITIVLMFTLTGCTASVVTTVNGEKITKDQVDTIIKAQQLLMGDQKLPDETIRKSVIDGLVNQTLLKQGAEKEGLTIPAKDLEERYQQTMANWKINNDMQKSLAAQGFTQKNMKELIETQMLIQALTEKISQVSDEYVSNYYKTHAKNYTLYNIKQYIASSEQEAIKALSDPSKMNTFTYPANQLPYPIQRQLHTGHAYEKPEVIKIDDKTWWAFKINAVEVPTFESIKSQITQAAKAEKQLNNIQTLLQDLKSEATITTFK